MLKQLKIGNVRLENNIFLAPMAGVTDLPFRLLCKEAGCGLVYTEMISAKGIIYGNLHTNAMLEVEESERPAAVQIFGSDPDIMAETAQIIEPLPIDIIDINMGCPAPKIVKNGEGSALMKNPALIRQIVTKVSSSVKKPVTVKIRKGFNDHSVNAVEIAKIIEDSGGAAVTVHGRTREQYYSGKADWEIIARVKNAVSIPVIGNGDIFCAADAKNMFSVTRCDGVMVARGAQGNPWIFAEILHYLSTGEELPPPAADEKIKLALRHAKMLAEHKGEHIGIMEMRKHVAWYTKGLPDSSRLRAMINKAGSLPELEELLTSVL